MELYLHIGIEKTGSSYLQSVAAKNRELLKSYGIHFPLAGKREADMVSGRISPGNGFEISRYLKLGDYKKIEKLLSRDLNAAKQHSCYVCLYSNELLAVNFAEKECWKSFKDICCRLEVQKIKVLLILRDPVDHALSLYKHRAKYGRLVDLCKWIKEQYCYGDNLARLLEVIEDENIDVTVRKYSSKPNSMDIIFFKDWLGVKNKLYLPFIKVNPSLTLSELKMIEAFGAAGIYYSIVLYRKLLKVPVELKARDIYLDQYSRVIISEYITSYRATWERCNDFLSHDEQLSIIDTNDMRIIQEEMQLTYSFSEAQIKVVRDFIVETQANKFIIAKHMFEFRSALNGMLNRIKDFTGRFIT